jgi:hypothetical protein
MARRVCSQTGEPGHDAATGLTEAYDSVRESARQLAIGLGVPSEEFDAELPTLEAPEPTGAPTPRSMLRRASQAASAAARLNLLTGYLEGLIEMTLLTEDLSPDQIARVRSALTG